jgi:3-methyladenine DNA glycosylase/8-oxoguanine DNA glycosylase
MSAAFDEFVEWVLSKEAEKFIPPELLQKISPEAVPWLIQIGKERRKFKELAELCQALDSDSYLIDVQCQEDYDLVEKWRAAWKGEL